MTDQIDRTASSKSTSIVSVDDVAVGALLAGKYRIVRVLGQGGMGIVVEAEHVRLGERVAIKFLSHSHTGEARERFEREARASVRLRSHHVARVRDIGELEQGQPYIVMELLEGADLGRICETTSLSPTEIVDLALQCCEALAEAHALGIVHRDIKPANLFITHDGERRVLKLLDFGVATGHIDDLQLTSTGVVVGTPSYMCPEQMRSSRDAEPHWDLWSLGVVMYEMFEGSLPFVCDSFAELAVAVLTQPPRTMEKTPPAVRPIVAHCLSKQASSRFLEAAELVEALAPHGTAEQVARTRVRIARSAGIPLRVEDLSGPTLAAHPTPQLRAHTAPASIVDEPPPPRRRWLLVLGVALVVAAASAAFLVIGRTVQRAEAVVVDAPPSDAPIDAAVDAAIEIDAAIDAPAIAPPPPPDAASKRPRVIPPAPTDAAPSLDAFSIDELMKGRS